MNNEEAIQKLQHAADYIFFTQVVHGSGKTMRGTADAWQGMSILHGCKNAVQAEHAALVRNNRMGRIRKDEGKQPDSRFDTNTFWHERSKQVHRAMLVQIPMMACSAS